MPWLFERSTLGVHNRSLKGFIKSLTVSPNHVAGFLRTNEAILQRLLEQVAPWITKKKTVLRDPIPTKELFTTSLRYLAKYEGVDSMYNLKEIAYGHFVTEKVGVN